MAGLSPNTRIVYSELKDDGKRVSLHLHLKGEERKRLHADFVERPARRTYIAHDEHDEPFPASIDLTKVLFII